jgi:hypothetical protein
VTGALAQFGYAKSEQVRAAAASIVATARDDGGWHPNRQLAPGASRHAEPSCPFGTQNILRALIALRGGGMTGLDEYIDRAGRYLLEAWLRRGEPFRPVGFGIGGTFTKVTYPFVGYSLLKSVDTLSTIPTLRAQAGSREMLAAVMAKRTGEGTLRAESISNAWAGWDFGQKKVPSPWITVLAYQAAMRIGA